MGIGTAAPEGSLGQIMAERMLGLARILRYPATSRRDLRIDFLRGLAISAMVVDHIGGETLLTQLSGGNRWIVSAAEFFVFLSGLVLGIVYSSKMARKGMGEVTRGLLRRTVVLYRGSVGMALGFAALFLLTDLRLWLDRAEGLGAGEPLEALVGIATLHHAYHGSDVLVMYTLMLLLAPVIFYLLGHGRTREVVLGSVAIWAIYQRFPTQATLPWEVTGSSFQVAPWQLLLVLGIVVGYHRTRIFGWLCSGSGSCRFAYAGAAAGVYLVASSYETHASVALPAALFGDATYGSLFAKVGLGPGRVVAFVGVAVLGYGAVTALWLPLHRLLGWLILPLGQNSLYVYMAHLFVLVGIYNLAMIAVWVPADALNLLAQLVGLGVCWLLVRCQLACFIVPGHGPNHTVG